jgi:hypothetical protein
MIDIEKLRKIAETRHVGLSYNYTPWTYMQAAGEYFPALLDELEAARAEIERLKAEQAMDKETPSGYWDTAREAKIQVDSWPQWKKDAAKSAFCRPEDRQS